jgi:accessory gene regulator protein AgrB
MNKKLLYLFLVFVSVGFQKTYSQSYDFKTTGFSVLEKNEKGKWGKWSDLELATMMVTLDTNKNRIVIYSQIIQLFEIIEYLPTTENESDIVYGFSCKDNDAVACTLSIITRKKQDNRKQLYISYGDQIIVYNIFNMD